MTRRREDSESGPRRRSRRHNPSRRWESSPGSGPMRERGSRSNRIRERSAVTRFPGIRAMSSRRGSSAASGSTGSGMMSGLRGISASRSRERGASSRSEEVRRAPRRRESGGMPLTPGQFVEDEDRNEKIILGLEELGDVNGPGHPWTDPEVIVQRLESRATGRIHTWACKCLPCPCIHSKAIIRFVARIMLLY